MVSKENADGRSYNPFEPNQRRRRRRAGETFAVRL